MPKITTNNVEIVANDFILANADNYASFKSDMYDGLIVKRAYGKKAKDIYFAGCYRFYWDNSKIGSFCQQKKLYDVNCTKEGFSVWFLPYSNLTNSKNDSANWTNYISSDFTTIKEVWESVNDLFHNDKSKRVTFAKQKNGQYLYLGIFQVTEIDKKNKCRIYKQVDKNYL